MNIKQQHQYNQGISRYKLLSANAGVGSIITSNIGYYILISDVNKWEFIKASNNRIQEIMNNTAILPEKRYKEAQKEILNNLGIELVNDERFIELLKSDKDLPALLCLAAIPHLSLNENFNSINIKDSPIIKRLKARGVEKKAQDFTIPGTHFPKWFRNDKGVLKHYNEWKKDWLNARKQLQYFAPPRDVSSPFKNRSSKSDEHGNIIQEFPELTQLNLILICENGHLSDIPWSNYLKWRTELRSSKEINGERIFTDIGPCCDDPDLKWSENKNRSEGYASIFIECKACKKGSGDAPERPKVNLQGINNLAPYCPGHKPWELPLDEGSDLVPCDKNCNDKNGHKSKMQIALVTGNSIYFANTFSSVYIPMTLVKDVSEEILDMLHLCEARYMQIGDANLSRETYADRKIDELFLKENGIAVSDTQSFLSKLREVFINNGNHITLEGDLHELYRLQEYKVFTKEGNCREDGLFLEEMPLPESLSKFFKRIKKVEELKVTSVQLDFTRVNPNERVRDQEGNIVSSTGQNVFSTSNEQVYILPAVENYGEGIFFEFNEEAITEWMENHSTTLIPMLKDLRPQPGNFNGNALRQKIDRDRSKFLLIHTFSHLLMRELEFTCGYPTASLKERLYIAPNMAGVLIYTAEGSEGSMGGLIWQAQQPKMEQLIRGALKRATDCSSDPLCWSSDGQGLFKLNLAACFSCALVSETACEERNLGLDRRTLIDPDFGFFTSLLT